MDDPTNIDVKCLKCWKRFVTSLGAIEDATAECPECGSHAVTKHEQDDDG